MQELKLQAQTLVGYTLACIVFFLPLKAQIASLFIIISLVLAFFAADWKTYWNRITKNKFFMLSIIYFILHLIGILYSDNLNYAFKDIESKLSFLIFPLLFTAYTPTFSQIDFIKKSFIAGCLLAVLICFVNAILLYSAQHQSDVFFYSTFSLMMHSTYFSFYINVALIILVVDLYNRYNKDFKTAWLVIYIVIEMIFIVGILLLSARMSLIVTVITLITLLVILSTYYKNKRRLSLLIAATFIVAFFIEIGISKVFNRFEQIDTTIKNEQQIAAAITDNKAIAKEYNSTTSRIALWKYAAELVTLSPNTLIFGVGTGDIKEELRSIYIENKFQKGVDENYNPHNQYLHTWVILGLIGLILLLMMLMLPFIKAYKTNNLVMALFIIIIGLNAITESILEVQSGIIFFCMMYGLLVSEMFLAPQKNNV